MCIGFKWRLLDTWANSLKPAISILLCKPVCSLIDVSECWMLFSCVLLQRKWLCVSPGSNIMNADAMTQKDRYMSHKTPLSHQVTGWPICPALRADWLWSHLLAFVDSETLSKSKRELNCFSRKNYFKFFKQMCRSIWMKYLLPFISEFHIFEELPFVPLEIWSCSSCKFPCISKVI